jgi:membrane-associated PAP2 superfamily phosphatase
MSGDTFIGDVIGGHLHVNGTMQLKGLKFRSVKNRSLAQDLWPLCHDCVYRTEPRRSVSKTTVVVWVVVLMIVCVSLVKPAEESCNPWENPKEL